MKGENMTENKLERGEDGFWHGVGAELLNYAESMGYHKYTTAEAEIMLMLADMKGKGK